MAAILGRSLLGLHLKHLAQSLRHRRRPAFFRIRGQLITFWILYLQLKSIEALGGAPAGLEMPPEHLPERR